VNPEINVPSIATREAWLLAVAERMAPWYDGTVPPVRVSVGFTSKGRRSNRVGECWTPAADPDGRSHIFIHPKLIDPVEVAATLAHELLHAVVGLEAKHGPIFRAAALALGLEGKMTSTVPGPVFKEQIAGVLAEVGPYPHGSLQPGDGKSTPPTQTTRMVKVACEQCGYTVRTTQKWLAVGVPACPACELTMAVAA
jgi:hypothetical protein